MALSARVDLLQNVEQLGAAEGLLHEVADPRPARQDREVARAAHHHHRQVDPAPSERALDRKAVGLGHAHVEQDQALVERVDRIEQGAAGLVGRDGIAGGFEQACQHRADDGIVFDEMNQTLAHGVTSGVVTLR